MSYRFKKQKNSNLVIGDFSSVKIGIVVSEWHPEVTEELFKGAVRILEKHGVSEKNIFRKNSPGSFELPLTAQFLFKNKKTDAVICLGCVIKGETDHYHYICEAVAKGIMDISLIHNKPVAFGVLTTHTLKQALDRAGYKLKNKGEEAAEAVLKMLAMDLF